MKVVVYYRAKKNQRRELAQQKEAFAEWQAVVKASKVAEFTEVEADKKMKQWPVLVQAIEHAKSVGASLVIARLDRLARNVPFTAALLDGNIEFFCCDNLTANRETVKILAAMAADDSFRVSQKTKAALAQAKAKGVKLGSARPGHWKGRERARKEWRLKGAEVAAERRSERARLAYEAIIPTMVKLEAQYKADGQGAIYERIAAWLNEQGHRTSRGGLFNPSSAWRLIQKYGSKKKKQVA